MGTLCWSARAPLKPRVLGQLVQYTGPWFRCELKPFRPRACSIFDTRNPSRSSSDSRLWRTRTWSSAKTMRIAIGGLQCKPNQELRSTPRSRVDRECSSDRIQALLDSDQSQPSALTFVTRAADIKPHTIIPNGAAQSPVFSPDLNPNPGRLCVFRSVSERFLYAPIECVSKRFPRGIGSPESNPDHPVRSDGAHESTLAAAVQLDSVILQGL